VLDLRAQIDSYVHARITNLETQEVRVNKTELVEAIAEASGQTKVDAEKLVAAFVDTITGALSAGDKVTIPGFGAFSVSDRQARTGRNPSTGEVINIAASKTPKFSAGSGLKAAVNNGTLAKAATAIAQKGK
jgi:DNA-binding protein HU-beta